MIDRTHELSLTRQAQVLKLSRSSLYYQPCPVSPADLAIMRRMDELHLEHPFAGSRMLRDILRDEKKSVSLEQEQREHKTEDVNTRLIAEYEEGLKTEPQNLRLVRSIAELLVANKEFDRALDYYGRLAGTQAADPSLERAIGETRVKKLDHQIALVDPNAPDAAGWRCNPLAGRELKFLRVQNVAILR